MSPIGIAKGPPQCLYRASSDCFGFLDEAWLIAFFVWVAAAAVLEQPQTMMKFYYSLLLVYCLSLLVLEWYRKQLNKKANIVYTAVCYVLDALELLLWCYTFLVIFDKRSIELFAAVEFLVQITLAVSMCFIHYTTKNSKTWAEQSLPSHIKRNDSSLDLINWNKIIVSFLCGWSKMVQTTVRRTMGVELGIL